jgi:hypothetical protein
MEITNRSLAILLVVAMIISLGGTLISLERIGQKGQTILTGAVTSDAGYVNLSVASGISITTGDNSIINFGVCTPVGGSFTVITSLANATICTDGDVSNTGSKNITVRNNGNVNVNVTMASTDDGAAQGGDFLRGSSSTSYIAYKSAVGVAGTRTNGCVNNTIIGANATDADSATGNWNKWTNLTKEGIYTACANLTAGASANSFGVYIMIGIPENVYTGYNNITLQFTASNTG